MGLETYQKFGHKLISWSYFMRVLGQGHQLSGNKDTLSRPTRLRSDSIDFYGR
jgi:hypothetical protein